jgi:hypothetical protein
VYIFAEVNTKTFQGSVPVWNSSTVLMGSPVLLRLDPFYIRVHSKLFAEINTKILQGSVQSGTAVLMGWRISSILGKVRYFSNMFE